MRTFAGITNRPALGALLLAFGVGACAHDPNPNLVEAEQQVRAAETDPVVTANAPLLLEDARETLTRGQRAWQSGEDEDEVDHLAYLTAQRVEIARLSAQRRADVERADDLRAQRAPVVVVTPLPAAPAARLSSQHVLEDVYFAPERSTVPETSRAELARAADQIVAHPDVWVRVEGRADDAERDAAELSRERAVAVANELIALGVDSDRLTIRGLGAQTADASSITADGRQRNRRVEIVLTPVVGAR